jgi:mannitol/fructose-specific phosphotransferase system IIA component (Ntr-type)
MAREGRMELADFMVREAIITDLRAMTKEGVIREIVSSLRGAGHLERADVETLTRAFMFREELGSTGIGQGAACPETRHPMVDRVTGTVALSRRGVEFDALDGKPVDVFFLVISPPSPREHLWALNSIFRFLRDQGFVSRLRQAGTREQVIDLLEEATWGACGRRHPSWTREQVIDLLEEADQGIT